MENVIFSPFRSIRTPRTIFNVIILALCRLQCKIIDRLNVKPEVVEGVFQNS